MSKTIILAGLQRVRAKRNYLLLFLLLVTALLYLAFPVFDTEPEKVISLSAGDFEHIQFRTTKPNVYRYLEAGNPEIDHLQTGYQKNELLIEVDNSASFLMQAFDTVKNVNRVSFEWKSEGRPAIDNADHEERRDGDDAVFKLGLLIETEDSLAAGFLPSWMRRVDKLLNFNSDEMLFLVVGAKHTTQQRWPGPYNSRMTMISVNSVAGDQGWNKASYEFSEPVKVVALWLMADGDNTHSTFTTHVKKIVIGEKDDLD